METNISMQQLKQQRLTPAEKFVLNKVKGVRSSNPNVISVYWYNKDDEWLFIQNFKYGVLLVKRKYICSVLCKEYGFKYGEIEQLLTKILHKYTNNGQLKISL